MPGCPRRVSLGIRERWAPENALAEDPGFAGVRSVGGLGGPSRPPISLLCRRGETWIARALFLLRLAPARRLVGAHPAHEGHQQQHRAIRGEKEPEIVGV